MAKIVRYNGNLVPFASASLGTERTIFGEVTQADDITSQYTADFLRGWGIVGPSDQPTLQDFNAVSYTHGQILSYLHQMGVAEYNAGQEYHLGSHCNVAGVLYKSLVNTNVGNTPASSPSQWQELYKQATESIRGTAAVATQVKAEAGVDDLDMMTALKTKQAIAATPSTSGISGSHSNLRLASNGTTAEVTITADSVCVKNAAFAQRVLNAVSLTATFANAGVNGLDVGAANSQAASQWYSVWVIWSGATVAGLLSLSATSPTLPSGYTHYARVGWVRTDGTANKFPLRFDQAGNKVTISPLAGTNVAGNITMASGVQGTVSGTGLNVSVGNFIPSTAWAIEVFISTQTGVGGTVQVGRTGTLLNSIVLSLTNEAGQTASTVMGPVSYTHLTLPTN